MAMMYDFDKEFVERTKELLENNYGNTKNEVTLLLNCLLALVTLPIERNKLESRNAKIIQFKSNCINKLSELKDNYEKELFNINDNNTFNHIRNSIAHLHIKVVQSAYENKIESIILIDAQNNKEFRCGNYNFKIRISAEHLKDFALYVANEYSMLK